MLRHSTANGNNKAHTHTFICCTKSRTLKTKGIAKWAEKEEEKKECEAKKSHSHRRNIVKLKSYIMWKAAAECWTRRIYIFDILWLCKYDSESFFCVSVVIFVWRFLCSFSIQRFFSWRVNVCALFGCLILAAAVLFERSDSLFACYSLRIVPFSAMLNICLCCCCCHFFSLFCLHHFPLLFIFLGLLLFTMLALDHFFTSFPLIFLALARFLFVWENGAMVRCCSIRLYSFTYTHIKYIFVIPFCSL